MHTNGILSFNGLVTVVSLLIAHRYWFGFLNNSMANQKRKPRVCILQRRRVSKRVMPMTVCRPPKSTPSCFQAVPHALLQLHMRLGWGDGSPSLNFLPRRWSARISTSFIDDALQLLWCLMHPGTKMDALQSEGTNSLTALTDCVHLVNLREVSYSHLTISCQGVLHRFWFLNELRNDPGAHRYWSTFRCRSLSM